jgi:hypothetical protein
MQAGQAIVAALAFTIAMLASGTPRSDVAGAAELDEALAATLIRWNGDIFWQPAAQSTDPILRAGDEARAVFGPIPDGDCNGPVARTIPREVDGNIVVLERNPTKPGQPLQFAHRDRAGNLVKWTDTLPRCDKPSLAGTAFCALGSRLARIVRGNVEWLFFCRKSTAGMEVTTDPYWQSSDPRFLLFGIIGFNRVSGEITFFDGRKGHVFDWSKPFVPPGGHSYSDVAGRAQAASFYDPTFAVPCHACHDNKSPYVIDPHVAQGRVGYFLGDSDPRAGAFGLNDYLPLRPRTPETPFRVVGSGYTSTYGTDIAHARTVEDPTGNCTGCHTLTTQVTGQRLAADAVGREPWVTFPTWAQLADLDVEQMQYAAVARHRTDWALRQGEGKIHPWMVPGSGNALSANAPPLSLEDWKKLSDCLWGAGGPECRYRPLYTPCPAPESAGETSALEEAAATVLPAPADETRFRRVLRVSWTYLNSYGGVPERDDVRFDVAVKTAAIPADRAAPKPSDYPTMSDVRMAEPESSARPVASAAGGLVIANVSYAGHRRWTDPEPSVDPRRFRLDLPAQCNQRYLIRLVPKRFCFDQSNIAYGPLEHKIYADIVCD